MDGLEFGGHSTNYNSMSGPATTFAGPQGYWIGKGPIVADQLFSLRDYFAGQAMMGFIAQSNTVMIQVAAKDAEKHGETGTEQTFARYAYQQADAMIAQREKGK